MKKSQIEDKSIRPRIKDTKEEEKNSKRVEYNYPGKVTIKAKSKEEADEKFKKLNKE